MSADNAGGMDTQHYRSNRRELRRPACRSLRIPVLFRLTMEQIDTLIRPRWIVPVSPAETALTDSALAVHNGRIVDIVSNAEADERFQARHDHRLDDHALLPGLVNTHTHAAMSLFRGMADDMPLAEWLEEKVWPAEGRWVNESFVYDGTLLAAAEMLRGGTTCFADMYFFPDVVAKAARQAGIRGCVGLIVLDFPTVWANDADEYLSKATALHDELRNETLIHTLYAPHAPYTVSDAPLAKIRTRADELEIPVMVHLHETAAEVAQAVDADGRRPFQRLDELGLVSPQLMAVHMTQLTDEEIQRIAETGASVSHCPESNMKLASGYCPVHKLLQAGANVTLGTDGAASNNDLDMIGEMRSAALLAKNVAGDPAAVPAFDILKMATLNGARSLGLADEIGSLEAGKSADMIAIDLSAPRTRPCYEPISQIVYAADSSQVSDVWVAGRQVLKSGELTSVDTEAILERADRWCDKINGQS